MIALKIPFFYYYSSVSFVFIIVKIIRYNTEKVTKHEKNIIKNKSGKYSNQIDSSKHRVEQRHTLEVVSSCEITCESLFCLNTFIVTDFGESFSTHLTTLSVSFLLLRVVSSLFSFIVVVTSQYLTNPS